MRAFSFPEFFPVANCLQLKPLIFEYARRNFVFWITIPDWMFFLHVSIRTRAVYCTHFSTGHKGLIWLISNWPAFFVKFLHCTLCFLKNLPSTTSQPFLHVFKIGSMELFIALGGWMRILLGRTFRQLSLISICFSPLLFLFYFGLVFLIFEIFSGMHVRTGINKRRFFLS